MESQLIKLPAQFKLPELAALHASACQLVSAGSAIEFDGSGVERADTAAVQFLMMCQRIQPVPHARLIHNASNNLIEAARDLGMQEVLSDVMTQAEAGATVDDEAGA